MIENILVDHLPTIDLHGLDGDTACVVASDFINDYYKMKAKRVVIIHGYGRDILRRRIHEMLKKHKFVRSYCLHVFNGGITVVELKCE